MQVFNGFMQNGIVGRRLRILPSSSALFALLFPVPGLFLYVRLLFVRGGGRNTLPRILEAVDDFFHLKGALKVPKLGSNFTIPKGHLIGHLRRK